MSTTRIKICGIRDPMNAAAAAEAGAWAVGLVFVKASPRHVTAEMAREIIRTMPGAARPVGLFVNASPDRIRTTAKQLGLKHVQLHGSETPDAVRELAPLRVIKAIALDDLDRWRGIANLEAVMFDAPPAAPGELTGGSGKAFDWNTLAAVKARGDLHGLPPFILAGGLTPGNVGDAIRLLRPYAVDVSSGVESSRGVKDITLIRKFCDAVRSADRDQGASCNT